MTRVIVVGGGWAGLAAAVELTRHHISVLLLESSRQLGGRARSVSMFDTQVDNGQHLMIGAYRDMLYLLNTLGIKEEDIFHRRALELIMKSPTNKDFRLRTSKLPAPIHLLWALISATGLPVKERWQALRMSIQLATKPAFDADKPLSELLKSYGQTEQTIKKLWEPLCLAMLNTPIDLASSVVFKQVLQETFAHHRHDSDLLIPRTDLGALLPEPAHKYINQNGGEIRLNHRVTEIYIEKNRITGILLASGESIEASHIILATSDNACRRLLAPHPALAPIAAKLVQFNHAPICTVYLRYRPDIQLESPMIGFLDTTAQWIFDRRMTGNPGLMAVVISSHGPHMNLNNDELLDHITDEIATFYPHWPKPEESHVIREKRATLLCQTGINALRPENTTPVKGCWLAGDYTATGYPSVLEGAVKSGLNCARLIMSR